MQRAWALIYCHLLPVWQDNIFQHDLITVKIFGKIVIEYKIYVCFSIQGLSGTFLILRRIRRDICINVQSPSRKVPVILVRFERHLNFLDTFSKKKIFKIKVHENPGRGSRIVIFGPLLKKRNL
jgi:hypothetical protein